MSNKWLYGGVGAAVVVATAFLAWNLRGGSDEASGAVSTASDDAKLRTARATARANRAAALEKVKKENARPAALSEKEALQFHIEQLTRGEVPMRIRTAASECYDGSAFGYKDLEKVEKDIDVDFTLVNKKGVMRLEDVTLKSGVDDPELEECVLDVMRELQWKDEGVNPDFSVPMGDAISMLSLKKYGEPMPHEMDDTPVRTDEPGNEDFGYGPSNPSPGGIKPLPPDPE